MQLSAQWFLRFLPPSTKPYWVTGPGEGETEDEEDEEEEEAEDEVLLSFPEFLAAFNAGDLHGLPARCLDARPGDARVRSTARKSKSHGHIIFAEVRPSHLLISTGQETVR